MIFRRLFVTIFFVSVLSAVVYAHPHMAIYSSCEFVFDGAELKGAWIDFKWDRYFSADIISGYDEDNNYQFDKSETEMVYENAFINLRHYGFFISIRDENGRTSPKTVENFSLYAVDEYVYYHFFIHLDNPANRELFLSVNDPTYYVACYYDEENPVTFKHSRFVQPDFKIIENTDYPIHYNPMAPPGDTATYDEWQPGLQTFFPEEIHLVY